MCEGGGVQVAGCAPRPPRSQSNGSPVHLNGVANELASTYAENVFLASRLIPDYATP